MARLTTPDDLRRILPPPKPRTITKVLDHLDEQAIAFLKACPCALLATTSPDGTIEVSPKGDLAGFIHVETPRRVVIPERAGNNLAFGLHNILANGRIGAIALRPGTGETLRFAGRVELRDDADLLDQLSAHGKPALLALRIDIERAYFHCARSLLRAKIWEPDSWPAPQKVSFGRIMAPHAAAAGLSPDEIDAAVVTGYGERLWWNG